MAEVEDNYASCLETSRQTLKQIRNTESSVHPTRENKTKITDQIAHLKHKDPSSTKIMTLEQELVRAEAENLVAEAQLTNVTRQKLKEAYHQQVNAVIERSEKQKILAKHSRRLLDMLDDTPVVPGADRAAYDNERAAKDILIDAEEELAKWQPSREAEILPSNLESNLLPSIERQSLGNAENGTIPSGNHSGTSEGEGGRKIENQESEYAYDPKTVESAA
jgi:hypothetical protein